LRGSSKKIKAASFKSGGSMSERITVYKKLKDKLETRLKKEAAREGNILSLEMAELRIIYEKDFAKAKDQTERAMLYGKLTACRDIIERLDNRLSNFRIIKEITQSDRSFRSK